MCDWYTEDDSLTPQQAADRFAREYCEEGRKATPVSGHWYGREWEGEFQLVGGRRTYCLTYNGRWNVSVLVDA